MLKPLLSLLNAIDHNLNHYSEINQTVQRLNAFFSYFILVTNKPSSFYTASNAKTYIKSHSSRAAHIHTADIELHTPLMLRSSPL